jgi:hypothetical protein
LLLSVVSRCSVSDVVSTLRDLFCLISSEFSVHTSAATPFVG